VAARAGEITNTHVAALGAAVTGDRLVYAVRDERVLLDSAVQLDASRFQSVLNRWMSLVDDCVGGDPTGDDERHNKRRVQLVQMMNGMWRLDGLLDPIAGEALNAALESAMPKPTTNDSRTFGQRRHDALADIANESLGNDDRPVVGGQRPHVSLIVHGDGTAHNPNHWYVSSFVLKLLMCDCTITPICFDINGQPVQAGTPTTDIPLKTRRMIVARDRCCRMPGCDRPARWTDIHHLRERENGGGNEVANLVLMCRFHHRQIHRDKLKLHWAPDGVSLIVTLANGQQLHGPPHPTTIPSLFDPRNN
jgi:Domain of unknown function (DUF222)